MGDNPNCIHFGQAKLEVTGLPQPGEEQMVPADAITMRQTTTDEELQEDSQTRASRTELVMKY